MVYLDGVDIEDVHRAIHVAWPRRDSALDYIQRFDDLYSAEFVANQRLELLSRSVWGAQIVFPAATDTQIAHDILRRAGISSVLADPA